MEGFTKCTLNYAVPDDIDNAEIPEGVMRWAVVIVPLQEGQSIVEAIIENEDIMGSIRVVYMPTTTLISRSKIFLNETLDGVSHLLRNMSATSITRFFNKKGPITLMVNGRSVVYAGSTITYEQVLELAGLKDVGVYTMTYFKGRNKGSGLLDKGKSITVNEGMSLSASRTDNA